MIDKTRGFALINILVSILLIIAIVLIGIFFIRNASLTKKISSTINQHESIYRFIAAYNFMCKTHPNNFLTFKTCTNNSKECKNSKNITPEVTKISCNSKTVNANNIASYFVMHFNETGYVNHYNKKNLKSLDNNLSQCCSLKDSNPPRGKTHIFGDNKNNTITIITNVGNKFSKDVFLNNNISWSQIGFK